MVPDLPPSERGQGSDTQAQLCIQSYQFSTVLVPLLEVLIDGQLF